MLSILFPCVSGGFHPTGKPVCFSPQIYNKYAVLGISKPYLAHHDNLSSRKCICSNSSIYSVALKIFTFKSNPLITFITGSVTTVK